METTESCTAARCGATVHHLNGMFLNIYREGHQPFAHMKKQVRVLWSSPGSHCGYKWSWAVNLMCTHNVWGSLVQALSSLGSEVSWKELGSFSHKTGVLVRPLLPTCLWTASLSFCFSLGGRCWEGKCLQLRGL